MSPYTHDNEFDWHLFFLVFLPIIIAVITVVNSTIIIISNNRHPTADELDPATQYQISYIEAIDAGVNILVESRSEHPVQIKLLIKGYRLESSLYHAGEYSETRNVTLKGGQSQTLYAGRYTVYTSATVEEVIVGPRPTVYVDLTWLAIMTFLACCLEWAILGAYSNEVQLMDPRLSMGASTIVTIIWMVPVIWLTERLIRHDVVFYILGIPFNFF